MEKYAEMLYKSLYNKILYNLYIIKKKGIVNYKKK